MGAHPVFARVYGYLERAMAKVEAPYRAETAGGARGLAVEIGAGTGGNLDHYPPGTRVVAVEPEPTMLRSLARRAAGRDGVWLVRASAEALPFRDGAFESAVASLVLCTVPDPSRAARELRRVLAPVGELRFYEHVRAADPGLRRRQDRLERTWGRFSGGCHPNRDTVGTLLGAGFWVRWREFSMPRAWLAAPHVVGVARPRPSNP